MRMPQPWQRTNRSGMRCIGAAGSALALARFSVTLDCGRLRETPDKVGLGTLLDGLLLEGTQRLTGVQWQDTLDGLGAGMRVGTSNDELTLSVTGLEERLPEVMELCGELISEPRFAAQDFERVRRNQLIAIETRVDRAGELAGEIFKSRVHGAHTIRGAPVLGTQASLAAMGVEELRDHWRMHARPETARLAYVARAQRMNWRLSPSTGTGAGRRPPGSFPMTHSPVRLPPAKRECASLPWTSPGPRKRRSVSDTWAWRGTTPTSIRYAH